MKKETEGYFVIKFKNKDKYIGDWTYCTSDVKCAKPFETRTKTYEYMKRYCLDKECVIEEVK